MKVSIEPSWLEVLQSEFDKEYFIKLTHFVKDEYSNNVCYPPGGEIFNAFNLCPLPNVKVVILGQDPYHGPGQAEGLCFSVKEGVTLPPSLVNIFKEVKDDVGAVPEIISDKMGKKMYNGSLRRWAKQGVLLLNAVLTVREGNPNSHKGAGWESFTDRIIYELNKKQTPIVFLLWGANAQKKAEAITNPIHHKLMSVHPSPLSASRGFMGCRHFSKTNEILRQNGLAEIDW